MKDIRVGLKRRFGVMYCVAIMVSLIIGSGIFIAPSGVIRRVSSPGVAMIIWAVTGIITMCGALMAAELGTTYPTSGSRYDYLRLFYGDFVAFLHVWEYTFITRPASGMIKCIIIAQWVYTHPCELTQTLNKHLFTVSIGSNNAMAKLSP